jgi:two-component system LytT family response regulator
MKIYKTLIIEDEDLARGLLKNYLSKHDDIEVIGEYEDGFSGLKAINELKPDLVFLDIQMPKLSGLELLELVENNPQIIFTTAYDEYAVKAFELNAVDYLLKPFSQERFDKALKRIREDDSTNNENINGLIDNLQDNSDTLERVVIKNGSEIDIILTKDIVFIEANDDYVFIHTEKGKHIKHGTMKSYEARLDSQEFFRIHRSYIVQIGRIKKISLYEKNSYKLTLTTGQSLNISRNKVKELKELLGY